MAALTLRDRLDHAVFNAIYSRSLIYNACWEDPAVDRQALGITSDDSMLTITSAGCNVLDYALLGPRKIHAVDANPRQNALLELKIAGIRHLGFDDFFAIFGNGHHPRFGEIYHSRLRNALSDFARRWWDRRVSWFGNAHSSFYFHGLSGLVARGMRRYLKARPRLKRALDQLLAAASLPEQRAIYDQLVAPLLWTPAFNWMISRQLVMSLLGVPYPQRKLVEAQHPGGLAGFIRESVQYVFRELPLRSNYFWRVYLDGRYARDCCPEYLKETGFLALQKGLVDCIEIHTSTVTEFLDRHTPTISRFVLLDHMDWMSTYYPEALAAEWDAIGRSATPDARILLRSAHARPGYLDQICIGPQRRNLREAFHFLDEKARALQLGDRVHTYAGFVIAHARG